MRLDSTQPISAEFHHTYKLRNPSASLGDKKTFFGLDLDSARSVITKNITKMKKILSIIAITLLLTSCDWINPDDPEFDYNLKSAKVITTNNNFGLELFNKILGDEEKANVMISPASISLALGMTYNGAETTTKDAFENVLNYDGLSREEVNEICRDLIEVLVTNSKGNLVEIANSIWYREGFPVHQDFLDMNSMYFDAEVRDIDFASSTAVDAINDWVSDKTHNKIDKIIDQLSAETMMLLINAL